METFLKKTIPLPVQKILVPIYRKIKSKWREKNRLKARILTTKDLISDLKSAGFREGDVIMVHSSLSRIGNVDTGADGVIQSLMEGVTQAGTILMPTYGSASEVEDDYKNGKIVDLRVKASTTGIITEKFRQKPHVYRSSHPFSSVCAWGKHAEYVTSSHADDRRICHPNSPIARFVDLKGKVVGIGVGLGPISIYHVIEDTWDKFPFEVHSQPFQVEYIDNNGKNVIRDVVKYDPNVSMTRIDHEKGDWIREMFTKHFTKKGILQRFRFGEADSWMMSSQLLYAELIRLAEKGITMYLTKEQWKSMNSGDENIDFW